MSEEFLLTTPYEDPNHLNNPNAPHGQWEYEAAQIKKDREWLGSHCREELEAMRKEYDAAVGESEDAFGAWCEEFSK